MKRAKTRDEKEDRKSRMFKRGLCGTELNTFLTSRKTAWASREVCQLWVMLTREASVEKPGWNLN